MNRDKIQKDIMAQYGTKRMLRGVRVSYVPIKTLVVTALAMSAILTGIVVYAGNHLEHTPMASMETQ